MVAAGNSGANACNYSPARTPGAITVGATNSNDARPNWSNYGTCLDVFAPGQDITSAYNTSNTATEIMWGTSMATPHVTGVAALMLQQNPAMTPAAITNAIKASATLGALSTIGSGSPNVLIYEGVADSGSTTTTTTTTTPPPPPPPAPTTTAVSVAALSGSSTIYNVRAWSAHVTIAVKNASGVLVPGVVVNGSFSVGGSSVSCTTASNGTCSITSSHIGRTRSSTKFTVKGMTGSGMTYNASGNVASSIVIAKP
jgi:subtilisin family serine protease